MATRCSQLAPRTVLSAPEWTGTKFLHCRVSHILGTGQLSEDVLVTLNFFRWLSDSVYLGVDELLSWELRLRASTSVANARRHKSAPGDTRKRPIPDW